MAHPGAPGTTTAVGASARRLEPRGALAVALLAAAGCMPLPPGGGLAVTAGPVRDHWVIQWDPVLRTPAVMKNRALQDDPGPGAEAAISDAEAEAAVQAVFLDHRDSFRARPGVDAIRAVHARRSGWLKLLRVEQTYKGVPVAGGGYDAHVLPGGRVGTLEGRFYPDIEMTVTPALDPRQAESSARSWYSGGEAARSGLRRFQLEYEHRFERPHVLVIVPGDGRFLLTWAVRVEPQPSTAARVYVDAITGAILGHQTLLGTDPR